MSDSSFFLMNAWRLAAGLSEITPPVPMPNLTELRSSEWSDEFEKAMRRNMIMGAFRYGRLGAEGKPKYDRVAAIRKRLDDYEQTGNTEKLVDIANFCLLEFVEGDHPRRHYKALTSGEHVEEK